MIREELKGTFFTLSLADARASLQRVPWVKSVALRRQWPDRLEITVVEHEPLARWNDTALVDTQGEEFSAEFDGELPQFTGPDGSAAELAAHFREFGAALAPLRAGHRRAAAVAARRLAAADHGQQRRWRSSSGATSRASGCRASSPTTREPSARSRAPARAVDYVDLRYRNGFAVRVPDAAEKPTAEDRIGTRTWSRTART